MQKSAIIFYFNVLILLQNLSKFINPIIFAYYE